MLTRVACKVMKWIHSAHMPKPSQLVTTWLTGDFIPHVVHQIGARILCRRHFGRFPDLESLIIEMSMIWSYINSMMASVTEKNAF